MKGKGLYFIIGGLVIAIIIVGAIMLIGKKEEPATNSSPRNMGMPIQQGGDVPSQEEIDNAQLIEVDGDVKLYQLPSGGNMKVKGQ